MNLVSLIWTVKTGSSYRGAAGLKIISWQNPVLVDDVGFQIIEIGYIIRLAP